MSGWVGGWGIKNSAIFKFFHGKQLKRLCLVEQAAVCGRAGGKWNRPARSGIVACAACSALAKRPSGAMPAEPKHILQTCSETSSSLEWKITLAVLRFGGFSFLLSWWNVLAEAVWIGWWSWLVVHLSLMILAVALKFTKSCEVTVSLLIVENWAAMG